MDDKELYRQILGVVAPWEIKRIELEIDKDRVDIYLEWPYLKDGVCPECGKLKYMIEEKRGSGDT